jgi:hypothetical protein
MVIKKKLKRYFPCRWDYVVRIPLQGVPSWENAIRSIHHIIQERR